jgi:hypothetical protein
MKKQKILWTSLLLLCSLSLLAACANSPDLPTKENIDRANKSCETQFRFDQGLRMRNWFTRWLQCKQEHVMPYEISMYPSKEDQIRAMYSRLIKLGAGVDAGLSSVQLVYREWEKMQDDIGMRQCLLRVEARDGSSDCAIH